VQWERLNGHLFPKKGGGGLLPTTGGDWKATTQPNIFSDWPWRMRRRGIFREGKPKLNNKKGRGGRARYEYIETYIS